MPRTQRDLAAAGAFDPAKSNGKTAVFSPDGLNAVYQYQNAVQVPRGAQQEKLGFLVNDGSLDFKTRATLSSYSSRTSDNAKGTPPSGAVYGMHGHIPGRDDGFVDSPSIPTVVMAMHILCIFRTLCRWPQLQERTAAIMLWGYMKS